MKTGIVVCSRLGSSRVPGKALKEINGVTVLEHLIRRLAKTKLPIVIACPDEDRLEYQSFIESIGGVYNSKICLFVGYGDDPLARMYEAAIAFGFQNIIRCTHDKIFVDPNTVSDWLRVFHDRDLEYMYSSTMTEGTGFEIISVDALAKAREKYDNVEFVSYAIKTVTSKIHNHDMSATKKSHRLLIDFPEDIDFMTILFSCLGNDCAIEDVNEFLEENDWANVNRLPETTVYTCAYNAGEWIDACMQSVVDHHNFHDCEYILIDDHSTDNTSYKMARMASRYNNIRYIRNDRNIGLSSSSNIGLKNSRGEFIIRIDADDYFVENTALGSMVAAIKKNGLDAIYPSNYFGSMDVIQKGADGKHAGCSMFKTRALNAIKFRDGLTDFEGLDLFHRAKEQLEIGYFDDPIFFYRQHDKSMSKTNLGRRERIKEELEIQYGV